MTKNRVSSKDRKRFEAAHRALLRMSESGPGRRIDHLHLRVSEGGVSVSGAGSRVVSAPSLEKLIETLAASAEG